MKEYSVRITETLEQTVTVKANSAAEARKIVEDQWRNSDHILDADDYVGVTFTVPKERTHER
jgi:hypothetical protein